MNLVHTIAGELPDSVLQHSITEDDEGQVINVAREWIYIGDDPALADYVGKIVRRDVWATIKCGHAMFGQQGA